MPTHVRVSSNGGNGGDSHAAGRARVRLKLAAIAYACARHGVDSSEGLTRAALALLAQTAVEYYEAIAGAGARERRTDLDLHLDDEGHAGLNRLKVGAVAYTNARHGIDADAGLSRAGLALLAQAAVEYYESIAATSSRNRPVDPHLQLDGAP